MTFAKGDRLTYIGHTDACKEECGWPCCPPGQGCPWEERVGKTMTVIGDVDEAGMIRVQFDGEDGENFLKYRAHVQPQEPKE